MLALAAWGISLIRRKPMTGLEAVAAANGWGMAVLGAGIVFAGLVVLSFAISLIHKVLDLTERKAGTAPESADSPATPDYCPADIHQTARLYQPLIDQLGDSFELVRLYSLTREMDFPHPHLTIRCFQQAGILVPTGDGFFTWNLKS
jgi:Na+-transporting methylmalonyl-CoA/oxaloacetate decarboxylase gamma subunit